MAIQLADEAAKLRAALEALAEGLRLFGGRILTIDTRDGVKEFEIDGEVVDPVKALNEVASRQERYY